MFVANVYRAQWKTFRHSWLDDEETPRHWAFNSYLFSIFSYLIMIFSFRCMVYWNTWDY